MGNFLALLILSTPALAEEPQVHRDIGYAEPKNERQTLDVYAPKEGKNHPVVFWIHGGGWQRGDKTEVQVKPQAFVNRGFVFVSTNYRFVPNVTIKMCSRERSAPPHDRRVRVHRSRGLPSPSCPVAHLARNRAKTGQFRERDRWKGNCGGAWASLLGPREVESKVVPRLDAAS